MSELDIESIVMRTLRKYEGEEFIKKYIGDPQKYKEYLNTCVFPEGDIFVQRKQEMDILLDEMIANENKENRTEEGVE